MTDVLQVSTATDNLDAALELARSVVEAKLAAGAQVIGPVRSAFWHDGQFGTGEEWQVTMKTTRERYPQLEAHLLAHHPWTNPDISAVLVVAGSAACLDWVHRSTETPIER